MNDSSMPWLSVSELSDQIHAGALSPVELMEQLLARVDSLNGISMPSGLSTPIGPWPRRERRRSLFARARTGGHCTAFLSQSRISLTSRGFPLRRERVALAMPSRRLMPPWCSSCAGQGW